MQTVGQELEQKTKAYWDISAAFYAGVGVNLNTSQALKLCSTTIDLLNPLRPLRRRMFHLQDRIIQGRSKRRKTAIAQDVTVQLRKPA